jgi:hypothetical protein
MSEKCQKQKSPPSFDYLVGAAFTAIVLMLGIIEVPVPQWERRE